MSLVLAMLVLAGLAVAGLIYATCRPHVLLYALAGVVSIMGINVHVGATFYLSRIVIIFFLITLFVRFCLGKRVDMSLKMLAPFVLMFCAILLFQTFSVLLSDRMSDGLTQMFIYMSDMALFLTVLILASRLDDITRAIKVYFSVGLIQGLYGVYQLIGSPLHWPTYQTLMAGIPTALDHTQGGYMYSATFSTFRSIGFFPADPSHYAGYLVGILLIGISMIVYKRTKLWPYIVVFFASVGLVFSLSRSGMLTFFLVGLPVLLFLLSKITPVVKMRSIIYAPVVFLIVIPIGVFSYQAASDFGIHLPDVSSVMSKRMADLTHPGKSKIDSMSEHILTRLTGLDALASSPMLGVGLGVNASPWHSDYYHRGWGGSHSHHLDALGQTGFIGAGLQFLFMAIIGAYMWRGLFVSSEPSLERHLLAGILAAYIAILLGNFTYHYFLLDFVWFVMAIGVALSRRLIQDGRDSLAILRNLEIEASQCIMRPVCK